MTVRIIIIASVTLLLQIGLLPGIFSGINIPELSIPLIVALALLHSRKAASIYALAIGALLDLYHMHGLGIRLLLFFAMAYALGTYRDRFAKKSVFVTIVMTLVCFITYQLCYATLTAVSGNTVSFNALLTSIFSLELPIEIVAAILYSIALLKRGRTKLVY